MRVSRLRQLQGREEGLGFLLDLAGDRSLYLNASAIDDQVFRPRLTSLLGDFAQCNSRLWADKLGQISLATTTLFWGVAGNLRYIVLAWAAAALGYSTTQASSLVGVVAIGTAVGAWKAVPAISAGVKVGVPW